VRDIITGLYLLSGIRGAVMASDGFLRVLSSEQRGDDLHLKDLFLKEPHRVSSGSLDGGVNNMVVPSQNVLQ